MIYTPGETQECILISMSKRYDLAETRSTVSVVVKAIRMVAFYVTAVCHA